MIKYTNNFIVCNNHKALYKVTFKLLHINPRFMVNDSTLLDYTRCYEILKINNNSDQETVRRAFIELCKKYHPDSGNLSADSLKFQEIEAAYRLLQNKFANEKKRADEGLGEYGLYYNEKNKKNVETEHVIFDIQHTAPQHRQYLSFDGIGSGTPSQRQKQFEKYRKIVAIDNVYDHHVKKLTEKDLKNQNTLIKDKKEANKIKTRYGIDRLVEDLIQESMAKGQFNNLKGQGKPLPESNFNPYVDFVTHKMNQVLIDNGFSPEWINLQKEIDSEINTLKETLIKERKKLGPCPLDRNEQISWEKTIEALSSIVKKLNQKINKFNLVVPILNRQKMYYNLEKESQIVLKTGVFSTNHLGKIRS